MLIKSIIDILCNGSLQEMLNTKSACLSILIQPIGSSNADVCFLRNIVNVTAGFNGSARAGCVDAQPCQPVELLIQATRAPGFSCCLLARDCHRVQSRSTTALPYWARRPQIRVTSQTYRTLSTYQTLNCCGCEHRHDHEEPLLLLRRAGSCARCRVY